MTVDPLQLASDIVEGVVVLAAPALLWLLVCLLAWEDPARARPAGIGRLTFWILLLGGLLGSLANLPIFPWSGVILAINVGGGIVPLLVATLLLYRAIPDAPRFLAVFLAGFAAQSGASFALLFLFPPTGAVLALALGIAVAAPPVVLALLTLGESDAGARLTYRRDAGLLGLAGLALYLTFLTTQAEPGLGIVSSFPEYLLAPALAGLLAVLFAPTVFRVPRAPGLALGYAAATAGVLIGADLLRQPPLYTGSLPRLYAIGGAGAVDLLYLSGLLALGFGYLLLRLLDRRPGAVPPTAVRPVPNDLTPGGLLRASLYAAYAGDAAEAIRRAAAATHAAADRARVLRAAPSAPPGAGPWQGMPVPPWIEADQRNLDGLAREPPSDPREGVRAWMTARWLVHFGHELARRGYAGLARRVAAFLVDLVVLTVPAVLLWYGLALRAGPTLGDALVDIPFNAAVFGYVAVGFLYFVLAEVLAGRTVGKWALGLRVTDRRLAAPEFAPVLVRDLPKLVPLWAVANTLAIAAAVLAVGANFGPSPGGLPTSGAALPDLGLVAFLVAAAVLGVGLPGFVSVLFIRASDEHQRLGDRLAGTWVVRAPLTPGGPAAATAPAGAGPSA